MYKNTLNNLKIHVEKKSQVIAETTGPAATVPQTLTRIPEEQKQETNNQPHDSTATAANKECSETNNGHRGDEKRIETTMQQKTHAGYLLTMKTEDDEEGKKQKKAKKDDEGRRGVDRDCEQSKE